MAGEMVKVGDQVVESSSVLQQRVAAVHAAYADVMREGVHYGVIPGTKGKPTLLKPGAEMLCTQFRLVPSFDVRRSDLAGGHREYDCKCTLTKMDTGQVWAQGVGLCTTMESKYRYRWQGYGNSRRRVDNADIADTYNTVLKMAKKRALVDATLTATGCSDMFTQDVEDFATPQTVEVQAQAVPATVDLSATRQAFAAYRRATGGQVGTDEAMRRVCAAVGAESMQAMSQDQADRATAYLNSWAREATEGQSKQQEQEQPVAAAPQPAKTAQAQEPELYDEEVEF